MRTNVTAKLANDDGGADEAPDETTAPCAVTSASEITVMELMETDELDKLRAVARSERNAADSALELCKRIELAVALI